MAMSMAHGVLADGMGRRHSYNNMEESTEFEELNADDAAEESGDGMGAEDNTPRAGDSLESSEEPSARQFRATAGL
ncbi:unnamed protein product [Gongylonema pulchrum]|uniref:Uncharacterized protein n=1 Tax=Gongylonema pulchrum TaxID=637853 RepID=A0A183DJV2_9BILA|nr:unnamed protein product [Gongylonema pulchrum]VDK66931.1 unnamed protein product [Gongylonema pulchrum]